MRVNTGIAGSSSQILALPVRNVLTIRVFETLSQAEINHEDNVLSVVRRSNQEVIWFDVSVDDPLFVDFLDSFHLKGQDKKLRILH